MYVSTRVTFLLYCIFLVVSKGSVYGDLRYIVFMRAPEAVLNQTDPNTINTTAFLEIADSFESIRQGDKSVGMGFIFSYFKTDEKSVVESLRKFLSLSRQTDIPVLIKLDGEQWWQGRPDLWNWWDVSIPGYDPENRMNVEWTGWDPNNAVKIAWRNWGRQIRVLPPPNLMSPRYRKACHEQMAVLIPIILDWYKTLPQSQKHLFIGINVGWESSIGVNSFYYPNGNTLLDKPSHQDPVSGINAEEVLTRGVAQIGFAAVKTGGFRSEGKITEEDLYRVVAYHLEDLSRTAAELGVPREKLFTHGAGWKDGERIYDAAVNTYSCPGWSFYKYAANPLDDLAVQRGLRKSDAPYWAAVEWMLSPFQASAWKTAIEDAIDSDRCKFICIYNWESLRSSAPAKEAIRQVLAGKKLSSCYN